MILEIHFVSKGSGDVDCDVSHMRIEMLNLSREYYLVEHIRWSCNIVVPISD